MALTDKLTAIADAIRAKTGKNSTMTLEQMPTEIASITTGGGGSAADVHYVTFMNGDVELYKRPVADGDDCADVEARELISTPTKESDVGYNYTYYGWGAEDGGEADANILKNITADKTVYAIYKATAKRYTITWLDDDGSVLKTEPLEYDKIPSYTPTKTGYVCGGWTPTPVKVTGDASYTVIWTSVVASGTCGTNLNWSLDAEGTLQISGTGAMTDWNEFASPRTYAPWRSYKSQTNTVIIHDGVTSVGSYAFYDNDALTNVTIADSVKSIGESAFEGCGGLTALPYFKNVTTIGAYAFRDCTNIVTFDLYSNVTTLGNSAFTRCSKVTHVTLHEGVTITIQFPTTVKSAQLPSTLKTIANNTFKNCTGLTSIYIPDSVTTIGNDAFYGCTGLTSINIPTGVTSIGNYAFYNCTGLTSIDIPNGVTTIGNRAFYGCTGLTSINIPTGVTSIGEWLLYGCTGITSITIPASVTSIGWFAFGYTNITSLTIPENVNSIDRNIIGGCAAITSVTFANTSGWWVSTSNTATSGVAVDVTDPATNVTHLKTTYQNYYWKRTA